MVRTYKSRRVERDWPLLEAAPRTIIRMDPNGYVQRTTLSSSDALESTEAAVRSDYRAPSLRPSTPASQLDLPSISSSPLSPTQNPFSDPQTGRSLSPPSSPPPALKLTPPTAKTHKPAFSFLKRKRETPTPLAAPQPLGDASASRTNAKSGPTSTTSATADNKSSADKSSSTAPPPAKKRRALTQLCLDLGGTPNRACAECGMEYVPSQPEDARLHRRFHDAALRRGGAGAAVGLALGADFTRRVDSVAVGGRGAAAIATVDAGSGAPAKRAARDVLEVVQAELGAVPLDEETLWGGKGRRGRKGDGSGKVYLYCVGERCVGACVAEPISVAARVVARAAEAPTRGGAGVRGSSLATAPSDEPVLLGIARIWTAKAHRGAGVATALLDFARERFIYGMEVAKEMVAFSQPTESGGLLAEKWFGAEEGWRVYGSAA